MENQKQEQEWKTINQDTNTYIVLTRKQLIDLWKESNKQSIAIHGKKVLHSCICIEFTQRQKGKKKETLLNIDRVY